MKRIINIVVVIFSITCLHAQNYSGKIEYGKSLVLKVGNEPDKGWLYKNYEKYESDFLMLNYILKFNNKESLFYVEESIELEDGAKTRFILGAGGGGGTFYVNLNDNSKIRETDAFGGQFLVTSTISTTTNNWTLLNEKKQIGNYQCYKATTVYVVKNSKGTFNHPVEAWYTTEIPIGFGPIGYGSLPGLIVELIIRDIKYSIKKVTLNPKKQVEIKKPTKGKLVTEEEFNAIGAEAMSNIKSRISN
jgi:GLPGLI family protein